MRRGGAAALVTAFALGAVVSEGTGAMAQGLDSVRWEYRPLLIFTPAANTPDLSRQTTILADETNGLIDRRLAVYIVEQDRVYTSFGAPAPQADAKTLRRAFRVPDDTFRVILIGLDGGAKLTVDGTVSTDRLFGLIDGMPMRRRELRERGTD